MSVDVEGRPGAIERRTDAAYRNQWLVVTARFLVASGDYCTYVAVTAFTFGISHSAAAVSALLLCRVVGGATGSSVASVLFKRASGGVPIATMLALRVALLLLLAMLPVSKQQIFVFPFIFLSGMLASIASVGLNSQIVRLVRKDMLLRTNAWTSSAGSVAIIVGSAGGGWLFTFFALRGSMLLNAVLLSFTVAAVLSMRFCDQRTSAGKSSTKALSLFTVLRFAPIIGSMLLVTFADTVGSASHNVGFPILSTLINPRGSSWLLGFFLSAWAIGNFGGAWLVRDIQSRTKLNIEHVFYFGVLLMSAGFILAFFQQTALGATLLMLVAGVGDGVSSVSFATSVQRADERIQLPVFSSMAFLQNVGFTVGFVAVAPLFQIWRPGFVVLLLHGIPIVIVIASLLLIRRIGVNSEAWSQ